MTDLLGLVGEGSGVPTLLAVLLTSGLSWLTQRRASAQKDRADAREAAEKSDLLAARLAEINAGADNTAMDHMQRSSDRLLEELTAIQSKFLESLTHAAELQGKMSAAEAQNERLSQDLATIQTAYRALLESEGEAEDEVDSRLDALEGMLSEAFSLPGDDETTDKFSRGA